MLAVEHRQKAGCSKKQVSQLGVLMVASIMLYSARKVELVGKRSAPAGSGSGGGAGVRRAALDSSVLLSPDPLSSGMPGSAPMVSLRTGAARRAAA